MLVFKFSLNKYDVLKCYIDQTDWLQCIALQNYACWVYTQTNLIYLNDHSTIKVHTVESWFKVTIFHSFFVNKVVGFSAGGFDLFSLNQPTGPIQS